MDDDEDVEDLDPTVSMPAHAKTSANFIDKDKRRGGDGVVNSNSAQNTKTFYLSASRWRNDERVETKKDC